MRYFLMLLLFVLTGFSNAETINYELYRMTGPDTEKLIDKGVRDYDLKEVEVQESKPVTQTADSSEEFYVDDGKNEYKLKLGPSLHFWDKGIELKDGFVVGARVLRDRKLDGFGLWLKRKHKWYEFKGEDGCSWDWFNQEKGNVFSKLQGSGKVKITMSKGADYQELASVEFLEDVVLRLDGDKASFVSDERTYHALIKKGSVLKFLP